jgi:cell division protein FtsW (lipid II flippase)
MFWPVVLPFEIAFWTLATVVVIVTALAPTLKWRRGKTFLISSSLAIAAFIPSCTAIMFVVDEIRFGDFEYATFDDVNDFRAERYLPTAATNIAMQKHANGYRARYSISSDDFHAYLDNLWHLYGEYSAVERGRMFGEGLPAHNEEQEAFFSDLGWPPLKNATVYYSPSEADGGGARYYFDSNAGVAMQRTGYW